MSVSYGGDKITFEDGSTVGSGWAGFKNRIINGAMVIDQRTAGAASSNTYTSIYSVDRWKTEVSQGATKMTSQQVSDAPSGFSKSLKYTVTSVPTIGSGDYFLVGQRVEGYNCVDLGWGASSPSPITLSFWVKSSLTGTFSVCIHNNSFARTYNTTYTIDQANTWEYKTITIIGDTVAPSSLTNGEGIGVRFDLGAGSTYTASTLNSWQTSTTWKASGSVNLVGTLNATWQITGVQLEKGSQATSFEYRPHGAELTLCKRYYERPTAYLCSTSNMYANYRYFNGVSFSVEKRASPTTTVVQSYNEYPGSASRSPAISVVDIHGWAIYDSVASATLMTVQISADAEL